MKCPDCNNGRRQNGFFTVPCDRCGETGKLSVDAVWKMRDEQLEDDNRLRFFDYAMKKRKLNNG